MTTHYFLGNTVLEAYAKSVQAPGEGLFIGDPLARPFGTRVSVANGTLTIRTTILQPGKNYRLSSASVVEGPYTEVTTVTVPSFQFKNITVPGFSAPFYKLEEITTTPTPKPSPIPPGSAPTIVITSPSAGDVVSGNTLVMFSIQSSSAIARVDLEVDGGIVKSITRDFDRIQWNANPLIAGTHTLRTLVYDLNGRVGTSGNISVVVLR